MSPEADSVIERLDAARQKWWLVSLLTTTVLAGCVSSAFSWLSCWPIHG